DYYCGTRDSSLSLWVF
nr:immunoglobulin light chain junction region [Macaca mulatta]MOW04040.1 immunoglobulin light chain junction region [Macaca mulatta]MOW04044.1 immunoglobulin light chain junction region [Macaca mulatta]MOW04107.1 immunoglobulin light chain junction region [Macaca mulatta]MOW04141.1 immunoglobulin light chain junction region [Macaca mulatta]